MYEDLKSIYKNRKVLITGHTGFKGSWLTILLNWLGAEVYGYALEPPTNPSFFDLANIKELTTSHISDIRDLGAIKKVVKNTQPEIVIHMAAQPLVRDSYIRPVETYETNVMGTVNLLEACRYSDSVRAIVNITTDKCYDNKEWHWGYREDDSIGGYDPYSNSKGCSELVSSAFRNSFYNPKNYSIHGVLVASARAGNVIGGGDWAKDRLIPDFIRAISNGETLKIRSPFAIRPWQHVLEPLAGYLILAGRLYSGDESFANGWNFGPDDSDAKNVEWITRNLCELWGEGANYEIDKNPQPHEANYLKLDCSKAKAELGWFPNWNILKALEAVVEWNKSWQYGANMLQVTIKQIEKYFNN